VTPVRLHIVAHNHSIGNFIDVRSIGHCVCVCVGRSGYIIIAFPWVTEPPPYYTLSSFILSSCRETHGSDKKGTTLASSFDVQITLTRLNINMPPETRCPSPLVRLYLRDGRRKGEDTTDCRPKIVTHVLQLQPSWASLSPYLFHPTLVSPIFSCTSYLHHRRTTTIPHI
jgi:hypothetical protein